MITFLLLAREHDLESANKTIFNQSATIKEMTKKEQQLCQKFASEKKDLEDELSRCLKAQELAASTVELLSKEKEGANSLRIIVRLFFLCISNSDPLCTVGLVNKVATLEEIKSAAVSLVHFLFPDAAVNTSNELLELLKNSASRISSHVKDCALSASRQALGIIKSMYPDAEVHEARRGFAGDITRCNELLEEVSETAGILVNKLDLDFI